jgi:dTDP-glucose pyrophosphorylase
VKSIRKKANNIILCAGPINYLDLPVTTNLSMAMIPVNGKPVIGWILDDLLTKQLQTATVVLKADDKGLIRFLNTVYADRLDLKLECIESSNSINTSLKAGVDAVPDAALVRIILGDTLIKDSFESEKSFAYTSRVESSSRWCVIRTDSSHDIVEYIDKQEVEIESPLVLTGYYHLTDVKWLSQCLDSAVQAEERELSRVLIRYGARNPLKAVTVKEWFDFGHIDTLVDSRNRLLQARFFNTLKVDPLYHTVTKVSQNNEKLEDELSWYLSLPEELRVLCPRIVHSSQSDEGKISITQEHYGYPTLAELYVYSDLRKETWTSILKLLFKLHNEFRKYPGSLEKQYVFDMYATKTEQRLNLLVEEDPFWQELMGHPTIRINGKQLRNLPQLQEFIDLKSKEIVENSTITIIHGDYCFSNILFDINSQIMRMIDPRGSFGKKGIYGDPRYDIAKLRHSISELYDFVVADMFRIVASADHSTFEVTLYSTEVTKRAAESFDQLLEENGYLLDEIKFIEALLFLSMIPLHQDKPLRQQLMYCIGINLLNDIAQ